LNTPDKSILGESLELFTEKSLSHLYMRSQGKAEITELSVNATAHLAHFARLDFPPTPSYLDCIRLYATVATSMQNKRLEELVL
jgi:hypothetical protein